jgi:hypothetical protein
LPYDAGWQTFQWFKFGYLYTNELKIVYGTYIRDAVLYALCFISSWNLADKTKKLDVKKSILFIIPTFVLLITFVLSPDPGWTDWTFAFRWPNLSSSTWLLSYLIDIPVRVMTSFAVIGMWKENFLAKK